MSTASRIGSMLSLELIVALEELFPNRCASLKDSDREVWFKAGQHDTVNFLRSAFDESNENILQGP